MDSLFIPEGKMPPLTSEGAGGLPERRLKIHKRFAHPK